MPWVGPDFQAAVTEAVARGVITGDPEYYATFPNLIQETLHVALVATLANMNQAGVEYVQKPWLPGQWPRPAPPPTPPPPDGEVVPFGTRPRQTSQLIVTTPGAVIQNLHFEGPQFQALSPPWNNRWVPIIIRADGVTVRNCDFAAVAEGIVPDGVSDCLIEQCRVKGIVGPSARLGAQTGNFVQTLNGCERVIIRNNRIKGGDTEDIISLWSSSDSLVEGNVIDGTGWTSSSGTAIILGDGQGHDNVARGNVCFNPGQVGIAIAGGQDHLVEGNVVYGPAGIPGANIAMYCADYSDTPDFSGHRFIGNRTWYVNANGGQNNFWIGNPGAVAEESGNEWGDPIIEAELPALMAGMDF